MDDASSRGLGAALLQDGRPFTFASKSLTPTEQRYANIEREMLAVVFGCKRFHTYVYAKNCTIESDHKPLEMIKKKNLGAAPPRLQRMLLETQGYEMQIKYHPGSEIALADILSRLPNTKQNKEINLDIKIQMVQFSDEKVTTLKTETRSDPVLSALLEVITECWPEKRHKLSLPLRTYWGYRDELSVEDSIILKGGRIVIPTSMQKDILKKLHTPHMGMEKTKLLAKSSVFWPSISNDIEQVTRQCKICNSLAKSQRKEPLMPHEIPTRPWQNIGTDFMYFDNDNYIIVTDYYSKFPFVRKIKGQCTSNAVITILKEIFSEHGIPEIVISDNGRQY